MGLAYCEVFIDSATSSRSGHENMKTGLRFKEEDRYSYRGLLDRVFRTDSNNLASDWRYRYSASGEREQKRMVYTSAWDSVLPYPWMYYLLGGSNEQYAVYHGQQTSGTGMCGDTGRRVYMYPAEYLTHGIGYTGTHEDISQVITDANGGKQFRISDHLASLRVAIDPAGITQCDYDPWGEPLSGSATRRSYNDREKDRENGLYNLGAREMSGEEGRFPSPDALAEQTPGQSPYGYANANPLRFTDPTGLQAKTIWDGVKDGAVDGLMGLFYSTPPGWAVQGIQALMHGQPPAVSSLSGFANAYHTAIGDNGSYAQARLLTNIGVQVLPTIVAGQVLKGAFVDIGAADVMGMDAVGGLAAAAKEHTTLFRAVGPAELADIQANGVLRNLGSAEGKYFTTSAEAASSYAKQAVNGFGDPPYTIIQTKVPNSIFEGLMPATVDRGIAAWVIPNDRLPGLIPEVLPSMPITH